MNKLNEEQKKAVIDAGKQGMKKAWERSAQEAQLSWWERLAWIILAGLAAAGSCFLSGCGHSVEVSPEQVVICRDGGCLTLAPGSINYTPATARVSAVDQQGKN